MGLVQVRGYMLVQIPIHFRYANARKCAVGGLDFAAGLESVDRRRDRGYAGSKSDYHGGYTIEVHGLSDNHADLLALREVNIPRTFWNPNSDPATYPTIKNRCSFFMSR